MRKITQICSSLRKRRTDGWHYAKNCPHIAGQNWPHCDKHWANKMQNIQIKTIVKYISFAKKTKDVMIIKNLQLFSFPIFRHIHLSSNAIGYANPIQWIIYSKIWNLNLWRNKQKEICFHRTSCSYFLKKYDFVLCKKELTLHFFVHRTKTMSNGHFFVDEKNKSIDLHKHTKKTQQRHIFATLNFLFYDSFMYFFFVEYFYGALSFTTRTIVFFFVLLGMVQVPAG